MKRKVILAMMVLLLCGFAVLAALFFAACSQAHQGNSYFTEAPADEGDSITVTEDEIEREKMFSLIVNGDTEGGEAMRTVAIPKLLAAKAREAGLPQREEDYEAFAQQYEQTLRESPAFVDNWYRLQKMYHMTMEEYFQYVKNSELLRATWYGGLYTEYLKGMYEKGEAPPVSADAQALTWEEYYAAYLDLLYENEPIRYVETSSQSLYRQRAVETFYQLAGFWFPLAEALLLAVLVLSILLRWRVFACGVAYLAAWLGVSMMWVSGPSNGAFGTSLLMVAAYFVAGLVLGFIASRGPWKHYLWFMLFVLVLSVLFRDFARNTLVSFVYHDPRTPFWFDPIYPFIAVISVGVGAVNLRIDKSVEQAQAQAESEPPEEVQTDRGTDNVL